MRFLHTSDLHIGKRVNGMSMLDDQRHILAQITRIARDGKVDAVLLAGDIYDKASPSAEAVTVFDAFLSDLATAGITVLAIPGNHDSAERIAYGQGLLAKQGVCFPPVYAGHVQKVVLQDAHGPVTFWLVPFLKPGDVRRFFPDLEIGDDYSTALQAVLGACEIDQTERNVALVHQLVTAGGWSPDRADDEIQLGGIDNVDVSVLGLFDYVALGHVHRAQRVGRDTVRYAGSPLKYSFSEARYDKSVAIVDMNPKAASDEVGACVEFRLVPLVPLHDMRELRGTLQDILAQAGEGAGEGEDAGEDASADASAGAGEDASAGEDACGIPAEGANAQADAAEGDAENTAEDAVEDPTEDPVEDPTEDASTQLSAPPNEDYLHITLVDEHPQLDAMARIREVYPNAMSLDYDNARLLAGRAQIRNAVDPDKVDTVDLFARFYEEQVERPIDKKQREFVAKAIREVAESVAKGPDGTEGGAR